jgi:hypothetical protein
MKRNGKEAQSFWDAAAGRLLLAEFIRVITRSRLVVWTRPGEGDEERFEAAFDTGASDIEIMVLPSKVLRGGRLRRGKGFRGQISWYGEDDAVLAELEAAIDAELYAEVEESCRASGPGHMQVAVIRRGAAPTMRPYGPADEEADPGAA